MSKEITEQKFSDSYDAIVIGAGNGGLAATAQLAKNGVKVLLLEQHNLPGGFATSFVRGRFEFETSLHQLDSYGAEPKGGIRRMFEDKFNIDAEFISIPEAYRLIIDDPEERLDVTVPFGIDNFINTIEKVAPGSKDGLVKFFKIAEEIKGAFGYFAKSQGKPDQGVLIKDFTNFLKTAAYSVDEVEDALNIPEKARLILNAYWAYMGVPTSRLNFSIYSLLMLSYMNNGGYIPKKRSHEFTTALDVKIREFGGKIQYNTRVEKILVEGSKVVGIETSNGDKIKTNHIISNASPTLVYNKLIYPKSEVPEIAYKEVNARVHGLTAFVVYLGLDISAEELGLNEYSYFLLDSKSTEKIYDSWSKLQAPGVQATVCLNHADPDCSPPGTCILFITTLFRPEVWENVKPEEYFEVKNKIAEDLIVNLEKSLGITVREHIEEIEVATPQTFARYTKTYNGVIYGYEPESWDSITTRFMNMANEKHIEGLEFAGGFGRRVHGYSSSLDSGYTAAQFTLGELLKKGEMK